MLGEALSCSSLSWASSSMAVAACDSGPDGASSDIFSRPPKVGGPATADVPSFDREGSACGRRSEEWRPEEDGTQALRLRATCMEKYGVRFLGF